MQENRKGTFWFKTDLDEGLGCFFIAIGACAIVLTVWFVVKH